MTQPLTISGSRGEAPGQVRHILGLSRAEPVTSGTMGLAQPGGLAPENCALATLRPRSLGGGGTGGPSPTAFPLSKPLLPPPESKLQGSSGFALAQLRPLHPGGATYTAALRGHLWHLKEGGSHCALALLPTLQRTWPSLLTLPACLAQRPPSGTFPSLSWAPPSSVLPDCSVPLLAPQYLPASIPAIHQTPVADTSGLQGAKPSPSWTGQHVAGPPTTRLLSPPGTPSGLPVIKPDSGAKWRWWPCHTRNILNATGLFAFKGQFCLHEFPLGEEKHRNGTKYTPRGGGGSTSSRFCRMFLRPKLTSPPPECGNFSILMPAPGLHPSPFSLGSNLECPRLSLSCAPCPMYTTPWSPSFRT